MVSKRFLCLFSLRRHEEVRVITTYIAVQDIVYEEKFVFFVSLMFTHRCGAVKLCRYTFRFCVIFVYI